MSRKASTRRSDYGAYHEAGTRWHLAVIETMGRWIAEAGHPADNVTRRITMRRLEKLELLISSIQHDLLEHIPHRMGDRLGIYSAEIPFAPDEAAALILWEEGPAMFLARKLLGRKRFEDYQDFKINMDWFYRPLENPRNPSIDRRWAHRSVIQPWPPG